MSKLYVKQYWSYVTMTQFVFLQGVGKLADGKAFTDPEVLRRLTSSVSCALDEAAAALTRMRTQNNGMPSSAGQTTADSGLLESYMCRCIYVVLRYMYTLKSWPLTCTLNLVHVAM